MLQQRYRKGIECYKRAIQNNDKNATTWSNLKFAYYGTEEYEKASYCEEKAERLDELDELSKFREEETNKPNEAKKWYFT